MGVAYNIVDVLDEYHTGIDVGEVFDKCAMATGTEYELALVVAEELVVGSYGDGVGAGFLLREADFVAHAIALLHGRNGFLEFFFEELAVVRRYGEMQFYHAVFRSRRLSALCELLFKSCAHSVGIAMECEESFRESAVVEAVGQDDGANELFVFALLYKLLGGSLIEACGNFGKLVIESEILDSLNELRHWRACCGSVFFAVDKSKESLEHARGRARGRNEFQHIAVVVEEMLPAVEACLGHLVVDGQNAVAYRGGRVDGEIWKTCAEAVELCLNAFAADTFGRQLVKVGCAELCHIVVY